MANKIIASLAGAWVLAQKNGGPKELGMKISEEGLISLTLDGKPLSDIQGAAYASEANTDGQFPVFMSIYSTSSNAPMGLSITNYTGVLITSDVAGGNVLEGTAVGIQDKSQNTSPVEVFGWNAYHLNV